MPARLLAVPQPTDTQALASDGFHPGASTYQAWGKAAAQAIAQAVLHP